MPAYAAGKANAIYPGDVVVLSSASISTNPTIAVAVSPLNGESSATLTVVNGSAVVLTVQFATTDTNASYQALKDENTGDALTVAATNAGVFNVGTGFVRISPASDPGATTITISR
jgi:hypothetical protein